jgi:tetratricopeptide (TPR) repeat protein
VLAAKSLPSSDRERLFIFAAEAFFIEPESADYWSRIRRWEQASAKAHDALPEDAEATLFYALAHLATAPATSGRDHADEAARMLVEVYERQPDHPGVMHYLVHANDVPGRERELLEITRKYDRLAPNNPHALHMPTHIYTRLGDWDAVVSGNLRAADAALLHPAGSQREFVWDEFAHAIEYLVYAYLQQGDDADASKQLRRLHAVKNLEPSFKTAFHLASTQSRYALERHAWNEAAAIVPRTPPQLEWDRYMWAEATARFARGLGAAHLGKLEEAQAQLQKIEALEATAVKIGEDLFARNIRVQRLELAAWLAHKRGDQENSLSMMREAAALEVATPKHAVTPGPTLPAYELLGDLHAEQKNFAHALDAYRESLKLYPRRLNTLLGAARAAKALGDSASMQLHYKELLEVASRTTRSGLIAEARRNLDQEDSVP